jgi:hypothetical protein
MLTSCGRLVKAGIANARLAPRRVMLTRLTRRLLARRRYSSSFPPPAPRSPDGAIEPPDPPFPGHLRSMSDQTYDDGRARNLEQILRDLAARIRELDGEGKLLANASELTKLLGEARSELFHYEVRATYDTPEVADSRRIVNDAIQQADQEPTWQKKEWAEDGDDAPEW